LIIHCVGENARGLSKNFRILQCEACRKGSHSDFALACVYCCDGSPFSAVRPEAFPRTLEDCSVKRARGLSSDLPKPACTVEWLSLQSEFQLLCCLCHWEHCYKFIPKQLPGCGTLIKMKSCPPHPLHASIAVLFGCLLMKTFLSPISSNLASCILQHI